MKSERFMEIVRFCLVGGGCFLLDYGLLYVLTEYAGIHYWYSSGISFTVTVLLNYWLCVTYVFHGARHQTKKQASIFIGSSIAGLAINQFCMWALVDGLGIYYMLAKLVATAVVTVWNYVMKRRAIRG